MIASDIDFLSLFFVKLDISQELWPIIYFIDIVISLHWYWLKLLIQPS